MFMDQKTQFSKGVSSPEMDRFQAISIKNFFVDVEKIVLKFIWKSKGTESN